MCTRGNFLGLSLSCHGMMGSPLGSYCRQGQECVPPHRIFSRSLPMMVYPAVLDAHTWCCTLSCCYGEMGIPFRVHCRRRSYGTPSLDVCTVICIVHPVNPG